MTLFQTILLHEKYFVKVFQMVLLYKKLTFESNSYILDFVSMQARYYVLCVCLHVYLSICVSI